MQVSVESTGALERKMTVEVPSERIDGEVEKRLKSLVGRARIDGFRPGKVPFKVVKQRYGQGVYQEVLGEVLQSSFQEAIALEKLQPAGNPSIEPKTIEQGKALEYIALFEIYPEFTPAPVDTLEVTRPEAEIGESDIDKMIETLRKQRVSWAGVERASQAGDQITIDFEGRLDGVAFDGGKAQDMTVHLGEGRMIASFEDQLLGLSPGEEKTLDVTFPDDYQNAELAGKQTQFDVRVKKVEEPKLPEVDDEFIKLFGISEGGVEAFRADVRANMRRELDQAIKVKVKAQVMDGLYTLNQVEAPKALISQEIQRMREQAMSSTGQTDGALFADEMFEVEAKKRVSLGLIIGEIIKAEKIELNQDKVLAMIDDFASTYEDPQQVRAYYQSNQQAMAGVEAMVLEEQVVDWALEKAKVSSENADFDSLMNPGKGA